MSSVLSCLGCQGLRFQPKLISMAGPALCCTWPPGPLGPSVPECAGHTCLWAWSHLPVLTWQAPVMAPSLGENFPLQS